MRLRLLAVIPLIFPVACSGPYSGPGVAAKETQAVPVQTFRSALETIPETITATGELLAEEMATIGAKVPGRTTRLHVDIGSRVEANQVLAEIEKDDYEFRVHQADALVNQTRARLGILDQTKDDVDPDNTAIVRQAAAALKEANFVFQTTQELQKGGVLSRIEFEKAQVRRQGAEAAYQAAREEVMQLRAQLTERRAQLALARQNLADCVIRAPFAGGITRRQVGLGEYLAVNTPVVTLVRQHPLRLRLEVPERTAAKVRIGQRIDVRLEGVPARSGKVVRMSPAIEAQSRSLLLEGEIPNEDGSLRPGSFAEATITVNASASGFAVPKNSIRSFAGVDRVFIVNGGGVIDERVVKTGRLLSGDRVEIVSGLDPGLNVIAQPDDRVTKGQKALVR
jgi:RND family efflux transporter MFP subunit